MLKKALADQDSPKHIRHHLELLDEVIQNGDELLHPIYSPSFVIRFTVINLQLNCQLA